MVDQKMTHLWLRGETKKNEARTALTPAVCKLLVEQGFKITVEKCAQRIFDDEEYAQSGCKLVDKGTWTTDAPKDALVIGLKELPENDTSPLSHTHIFFAHCYKGQAGWKEILSRFDQGNGIILDLEFLNDEKGRRVAAFGYHAGFAGAAIGLEVWCTQQLTPPGARIAVPPIKPYPNETELISYLKGRLEAAKKVCGRLPKVLVIGALGRCGTGSCDFATRVGLPEESIIRWDMAETAKGGPFKEIIDADIFVNCIYLTKPIPPFITQGLLDASDRKLSVIVDVSCDTTNPNNPIPVYDKLTTFDRPTLDIKSACTKPLQVVAIDHLPTLLPREASEAFCKALYPSLLELPLRTQARVWKDAEKIYHDKVAEIKNQ